MSEQVLEALGKVGNGFNGVYRFYAAKGDTRSASFGAYQGGVSITIWDSAQKGAPVQSIPFTREMGVLFVQVLKKLISAQPNTSMTIGKPSAVKEGERFKFVKDVIFKFTKTEKQTYTMEISSLKLGAPTVQVFKPVGAIELGVDELTEGDKSALAVKGFISFIESEVPNMRIMSMINPKPRKPMGGGSGSNNRYNAPSTTTTNYSNDSEEAY